MTKKNSTSQIDPTTSKGIGARPLVGPEWFADESLLIWSFRAALIIQLVLFTAIAYCRLTDTDEGLYLLATKLVAHGRRPYLDFFFQQMPALPYIYALWSKAIGLSWTSGRILSVLFSTALGGLLYRHVEQLYSRKTFACLAVILYAFNNLVIAWHPVVKTYALSNFFLFCAYLLGFPKDSQHDRRRAFLSGLFLAFAVDTRLYLIVVAPVLMLSLYWFRRNINAAFKNLALFIGGLWLGLVPAFWFLWRAPGSFVFDNLGYHLIRHDLGLRSAIRQKAEIIFAITNLQASYDGSGAQFAILGLLAVAAVLFRNTDRRLFIPFALGFVLFVVCLLPSPTFPQYFCVCIPFMIIVAIGSINILSNSHRVVDVSLHFIKKVGLLVAGFYMLSGVLAFYNYTYIGNGVEGIWNHANTFDYKLSTVKQVARELDRLAKGQRVISFWPGYLVECHCIAESRTENDFGLWVSPKVTPAEAAQYKVITSVEVDELLEKHDPKAVVIRSADIWGGWGISFRDALRKNGYQLVRKIGRAEIYSLPDKN